MTANEDTDLVEIPEVLKANDEGSQPVEAKSHPGMWRRDDVYSYFRWLTQSYCLSFTFLTNNIVIIFLFIHFF